MERVNDIIENYVFRQTADAVSRVEKIRRGGGCGCRNCVLSAVREANSWIDFLANDEDLADGYHYYIYEQNGILRIGSNYEDLKKVGIEIKQLNERER